MRRLLHILPVLIFALAAVALGTASAQVPQERIAWVRTTTGSVEVRPVSNPPRPFEPLTQIGRSLFSGDVIRTGMDGRAVIQFADGSRLYCFEEAELTITEGERGRTVLGFDVKSYTSRLIDVARGAVGIVVKPNEDLSTEVQSPTAVVGVRGTVIEPFRVDPASGETLVGLKRGRAWGYTPDGQAAFEMSPGLLARLGRDALGRSTVRSEAGPLGLLTRDHKIRLERGQGVFLDLKTARGQAVIGALRGSKGRVAVEAGGNRALLGAKQSLKTLVDRKAGRVSLEALQGKFSITDKLGKSHLLVPGKPTDLGFKPPTFEPRVIPGPKPKTPKPKAGPITGLPKAKGKAPLAPAIKGAEIQKAPKAKLPGPSKGATVPGGLSPRRTPKAPTVPDLPGGKGSLKLPGSGLPTIPKSPPSGPTTSTSPSPLQRLFEKALPPRSVPTPSPAVPKTENPKKPTHLKEQTSKTPVSKDLPKVIPKTKEPLSKQKLTPKGLPRLQAPFRQFRR